MSVFDLWLPILLTGLATHVLSTIAWMLLPHHRPEWNRLPVEEELVDLLHARQVPANQYMFPYAASQPEMQSDAYRSRQAKCRGMLILWPTPPNMGAAIGQTLAWFFFAAFSLGYLASIALVPGESFLKVFRFMTMAGLLTYCYAHFPHVFWFRRRTAMELLDGAAFALAAGLIFAACWPAA